MVMGVMAVLVSLTTIYLPYVFSSNSVHIHKLKYKYYFCIIIIIIISEISANMIMSSRV